MIGPVASTIRGLKCRGLTVTLPTVSPKSSTAIRIQSEISGLTVVFSGFTTDTKESPSITVPTRVVRRVPSEIQGFTMGFPRFTTDTKKGPSLVTTQSTIVQTLPEVPGLTVMISPGFTVDVKESQRVTVTGPVVVRILGKVPNLTMVIPGLSTMGLGLTFSPVLPVKGPTVSLAGSIETWTATLTCL